MCTDNETDVGAELSLTGGLVERIVGETSKNPTGYREWFRLLARRRDFLFLFDPSAPLDYYATLR
jgi:hypothetical protein